MRSRLCCTVAAICIYYTGYSYTTVPLLFAFSHILVSYSCRCTASLPPLHNFSAHLDQTRLRLTVRKEGDRFNSFIDVFLRQDARLLEAGAACYDIAGLFLSC